MAELQLGNEANFETLKNWIEANPDKAKISPTELSIKDYERYGRALDDASNGYNSDAARKTEIEIKN